MTKVDLITGFLGAGKTTFLLRYARHFIDQGMNLSILVYDHGAVNVDMPLLNQLRGEHCEIEMLAGACDPDCHRRRFRTKLISMWMRGFDRILIEPSGIFDMDEYFDTLNESPLDKWFEPGSVIAIVDARMENSLTPEEDYYLASQAASAGAVVLSRVQTAARHDIAETVSYLQLACKRLGTSLTPDRILAKPWDDLTEADFLRLERCGFCSSDYVKITAGSESSFQSLSFLDLSLSRRELEQKTKLLFSDSRFGRILRVKGFFEEAGQWYQINATEKDICMEDIPENRSAIIVIGSNLNEDAISVLFTGKVPEHHIL